MKQFKKIGIVFFGLMLNGLVYAQLSGPVEIQTTPVPDRTETSQIMYVIEAVSYTPGGVTFTYPVGAFTVAPCVHVQAVVPTAVTDTMFIASVSNDSASGLTITVYKFSFPSGVPTSVVEASLSDNVTVCIYASGA